MLNDDKIAQWQEAKKAYEAAKQNLDSITSEIAEEMISREIKSDTVVVNNVEYKVTVVQTESVKFDENSLFESMGKRAFDKIADLKLNKKKLEAAIRDGRVDAELISRNAIISKSTPYIRVTERNDED